MFKKKKRRERVKKEKEREKEEFTLLWRDAGKIKCAHKRSMVPETREVIVLHSVWSKIISFQCLFLKGIQTEVHSL